MNLRVISQLSDNSAEVEMGSSDKINMERDVHELGNVATAKAYEARGDHDSKLSRRDFDDREQLARLGKKSVLRVRTQTPWISFANPFLPQSRTFYSH